MKKRIMGAVIATAAISNANSATMSLERQRELCDKSATKMWVEETNACVNMSSFQIAMKKSCQGKWWNVFDKDEKGVFYARENECFFDMYVEDTDSYDVRMVCSGIARDIEGEINASVKCAETYNGFRYGCACWQ
ncbi:MAG: hypothetical protein LBR41_00585 [Rickettsiales bacterium]|jgi:hypothetical protein|nr:hypothetical protein [Rickettsiales bacterium]